MHSYYEDILKTAEEGENLLPRYQKLCTGIDKIQCSKAVGYIKKKDCILVLLGNSIFANVEVEEEYYKLNTTYTEWTKKSHIRWEVEKDIASNCIDMPDECVGEITLLAHFVEKQLLVDRKCDLYENQLKQCELDQEDSLKGDPRSKFIKFFEPLVKNTPYYFQESKDGKILDLKITGAKGMVFGFQARVAGENKGLMYTFFDQDIYEMLNKKISLPANVMKDDRKKQPHVYISLKKLWNCVCVITGNEDKLA